MTIMGRNPGNIRHDKTVWLGLDDPPEDGHGFCRFKTMQLGIRALAKILLTYQDKHGLNTITGVISRWAPPSENNIEAYVDDVAGRCAVRPDDLIDLHDIPVLTRLVSAIIHHETGEFILSDIINSGIAMALNVGETNG